MIIARKILSKALPFRPLLRYMDSTQSNGQSVDKEVKHLKLSPEAQRALWANHFINTIIKQPLETSIEKPSLRYKLIDSPNPIPGFLFDQAIKTEMTGIFTEGVYFNRKVYKQARITQARNQNDNVTFYPSVFVTKIIFTQMRFRIQRMMFQGSYGIGKTISIAFYIYLSNIINSYALLAVKDEKLLKEYESLVQKAYLPRENKKYWYWSMNWDLVQGQDFSLSNIFAEQATELSSNERDQIKKCKTVEESQKKIKELYKQVDFEHIAVLDQINHAVSFIRKWNQFVQANQQLIDDANNNRQVKQADKERINQFYQPTTQLIKYAKQFTAINQFNYVLNSSLNIENKLLEQQSSKEGKPNQKEVKPYKPLIFQLKNKDKGHSPLKITSFPFQKEIQTQGGRIHFWNFFLDVLEEKLQSQNVTAQEWKNFKNAFLQYACSFKLKGYYRFLHIRLFLQKYKVSKADISSGSDINKTIRDIIINFEVMSLDNFTENIKRFMQKDDIEFKKKMIQGIYDYASSQIGKKLDRIVLDFQRIGMRIGSNQLAQRDKLIAYLRSSDHNKQLIPVENVTDSQKVEILWSPQNFVDIVKPIVSPGPYNKDKNIPQFLQRGVQRNPVLRGGIVESLIQDLLAPGAVFTFRNVEGRRKQKANGKYLKKRTNLTFEKESIQIKDRENFIALNSRSVQRQFLEQYFQNVLTQCQKNPGSWIAAVPIKGDRKNDDDIVFNNPSIDFAIVKCNINKNNQKEFIIYTYDVATGFTSISQKEKKAQALLLQKAKGFKRKIQVRHHILCLDKHCRFPLQVNKEISIYYSSIIDMKIKEAGNLRQDRKSYEEVIKVVIEEYQKYLKA